MTQMTARNASLATGAGRRATTRARRRKRSCQAKLRSTTRAAGQPDEAARGAVDVGQLDDL